MEKPGSGRVQADFLGFIWSAVAIKKQKKNISEKSAGHMPVISAVIENRINVLKCD